MGNRPEPATSLSSSTVSRGGALDAVFEQVWYREAATGAGREHSLPSGHTHVAIRLDGPPLRLYDGPADRDGRFVDPMVVAGARAVFTAKEAATGRTVGAQLRPGASAVLFGVSAGELAGRHVPLGELLPDATDLREELAALSDPAAIIGALSEALVAQARPIRAMHPDIAVALQHWSDQSVRDLVAASGRSHRSFTARFRDAVGLAPKKYARVQRFRRLLAAAREWPDASWGVLAARAGYADQAHMNREFVAFAGVTPGEYRRAEPRHDLHLPVNRDEHSPRGVEFVQDTTRSIQEEAEKGRP